MPSDHTVLLRHLHWKNIFLRYRERQHGELNLEIYAAATMLQVPVYVCTQKDGTLAYCWEIYKPLWHQKTSKQDKTHFELAHVHRCHYEVVTMLNGSQPTQPLELPQAAQSYVDLTQ